MKKLHTECAIKKAKHIQAVPPRGATGDNLEIAAAIGLGKKLLYLKREREI